MELVKNQLRFSFKKGPVQSSHAGTSSGHAPPITIKTEVPNVYHPHFSQPSTSSFILGSRVSIETVILDSNFNSSDEDDYVVLSKLLSRFKKGDQSGQSSTPASTPQVMRSSTRVSPPYPILHSFPPSRVIPDIPTRTADCDKSHVHQVSFPVTSSSSQSFEGTFETNEVDLGEDTNNDYIPGASSIPILPPGPVGSLIPRTSKT